MHYFPMRLSKITGLLVGSIILILAVSANAAFYNVTHISNAYPYPNPKINDIGQIVWCDSGEIYLYKDDRIIKITNNNYPEGNPEIDINGYITWWGSTGFSYDVYVYNNLATKKIDASSFGPSLPQINNRGHIAWIGPYPQDPLGREVHYYNGSETILITSDGSQKQNVKINSRGQIVWEQPYDLFGSKIYCYDNGTIFSNTGADNPQINDRGQIVWSDSSYGGDNNLYLYDNGIIKKITDSTNNYRYKSPKINNFGEIAWIENDGVWIYKDGAKVLLNDYCSARQDLQINDFGQVAWYASGADPSQSGIYLYSNGGVTRIINGVVSNLKLNNAGQIVMLYWDGSTYQIYLASPQAQVANKLYGLFIGVDWINVHWWDWSILGYCDVSGYMAGEDASQLSSKFNNLPNVAYNKLLRNDYNSGGVSLESIQTHINLIKNKARPGDVIWLYFSTHGVSPEDKYTSKYAIAMGKSNNSETPFFLDKDTLYSYLNDIQDGISIWVIIDACHAGGFWDGCLGKLKNVCFLGAATKDTKGTYVRDAGGGRSIFNWDICDALIKRPDRKLVADLDKDGNLSFEELAVYVSNWKGLNDYKDQIVYEASIGDAMVFSLDLWNPQYNKKGAGFNIKSMKNNISPSLNMLLLN